MKKILSLFVMFALSLSAWSNGVEIGGLHYLLDRTNLTASVTYCVWPKDESLYPITNVSDLYTGTVVIPSSVSYLDTIYSVNSIGANAFFGSKQMNSVLIPNTVTSIGYMAFAWCSGLKELTFPESLQAIGQYMFTGDMSSVNVSCLAQTPPTVTGGDPDLGAALTIHVPSEVIPRYRSTLGWSRHPIKPLLIEIEQTSPDSVNLTWLPVDSASLYELHIYTDSTSSITLDTTLSITADNLNGGIMQQSSSSLARIKRIVLDDIGTVVVISIDPSSGGSLTNPFVVTVSTTSRDEILCHFDVKVYSGDNVIKADYGVFTLNAPPTVVSVLSDTYPKINIFNGIYDLQGRRFEPNAWSALPAGIYIRLVDGEMTKVLKR